MNSVNWAAAGVVIVFALLGIRFIATFRHNNDLYYMFRGDLKSLGTKQIPGLEADDHEVDGEAKDSSPALVLSLGIISATFAAVVLFVPTGVGLVSLLRG